MGACPSCGSSHIEFSREQIQSGYMEQTNTRGKNKGHGIGVGVGIGVVGFGGGKSRSSQYGSGVETARFRTVGMCHDCGYTWTTNSDQSVTPPAVKRKRGIIYWTLMICFFPWSLIWWYFCDRGR